MGYAELLIWQYKDKPKAVKLITGFDRESVNWQVAMKDLTDCLDVDTAKGKNLDLVGAHAGVSRTLTDAVPLFLFGFRSPRGGMSKGGVGGARFWRLGSPLANNSTLEDPEYRMLIKSAIIKYWSSDTIVGLQEAANSLLGPGSVEVYDNQNMTITAKVLRGVSLFEKFALEQLDILPRPPAVKLILNFTVK